MKNFVQQGHSLSLAAPYNVLSGAGFLVGAIFAVAAFDALLGEQVEGVLHGVYTLPKTSAQAWTEGALIYWDNTNKRCDTDGTVGMLIGTATDVAANPSSTGTVRLNGTSPRGVYGAQEAIADIATVDATDLASAIALANNTKAKINELLAALRADGILAT